MTFERNYSLVIVRLMGVKVKLQNYVYYYVMLCKIMLLCSVFYVNTPASMTLFETI